MDRQEITGKWTELKGKIRQRWGELTDDEVDQTQGRTEELVGKIQQKYGGAREEIRRQIQELQS